jgi:hypothetical protein
MHVAACPITVHALLHIAPTIRAIGPVWTYWAFPMERHCGDILQHVRNRRFPYVNINKYVTSRTHLTQIMLLYDLGRELHLLPPVSHDKDVKLPTCKSSMMFVNLLAHYSEPDPLYIFTPPIGSVIALSASLWTTFTATLATRFDKSASIIWKLIPKNT